MLHKCVSCVNCIHKYFSSIQKMKNWPLICININLTSFMFGTKNGDTAYWNAPEGTNILFKMEIMPLGSLYNCNLEVPKRAARSHLHVEQQCTCKPIIIWHYLTKRWFLSSNAINCYACITVSVRKMKNIRMEHCWNNNNSKKLKHLEKNLY